MHSAAETEASASIRPASHLGCQTGREIRTSKRIRGQKRGDQAISCQRDPKIKQSVLDGRPRAGDLEIGFNRLYRVRDPRLVKKLERAEDKERDVRFNEEDPSGAPVSVMFQLMWIVPVMVVTLYIFSSIKILSEYERGVVFRLGRVLHVPRPRHCFSVRTDRPHGQDVTQG
jgi:hypothetical protein